MIDGNCAMEYDLLTGDIFRAHLVNILEEVINVAIQGKEAIVDYSLLGEKRATAIQGYQTLPYLNVDKTSVIVVPD